MECSEIRTTLDDEHFPFFLSVRTLGGAPPEWAERLPRSTEAPRVEIVVVRDTPRVFRGWDDAKPRFVIVNSDLEPERFHGAGVVWLLSAPAADLDVIAEGCFRVACGDLLICCDLGDAIDVAGGGKNALRLGRASVVPGRHGDSVCRAAREALRAFTEDGFDGGVALLQGVAKADEDRASLLELDETAGGIISDLGDRGPYGVLLSAYFGAVTTAWTVIAFRKPDDPISRRDSDER